MNMNNNELTRIIPPALAPVVARLELDRPQLVGVDGLTSLLNDLGIEASAYSVAQRLRDYGWLLPTSVRGVWEFAPGELAGAISSGDALLPLKAIITRFPDLKCGLTFQSAAWAYGLADRVPSRIEVAFATERPPIAARRSLAAFSFKPVLPYSWIDSTPALAVESILVHMALQPTSVRSWSGALEWLPNLAFEAVPDRILEELAGRAGTVSARMGYLLSGLRPDIARSIHERFPPTSRTRFGPRTPSTRSNEFWLMTDTLLPFDPTVLEAL